LSLTVSKAVSLLFNGETSKEIAERFGITPQTVRNRLRDFTERGKEVGLMKAADEYEITKQVKSLMKLARDISKSNSTLDECIMDPK
jgi:predicted transcriptional regulator